MQLGIIGVGSMGSMLTRAWCRSGEIEELHLCNRSTGKAEQVRTSFPHLIHVHATPESVVKACEWVLLCVKAEDAKQILPVIAPHMHLTSLCISTNSALSLHELESALPCAAAKLLPSITQEVRAGSLLVMEGKRMSQEQSEQLHALLSAIGTPARIAEEDLRLYSDMTSCGPAFLADWLHSWAQAAAKRGVPEELAQKLLTDMTYGVGKLCASGYTLADIIKRVAVPGGVTEVGLQVLRSSQDTVFDDLFTATAQHQHAVRTRGHH